MKLLLITCRKIDQNGGESALIMGRHIALFNKYGIETDILFFHKDSNNEGEPYPGIRFLKGKENTIYERIQDLIETGNYGGIVCSGFYDRKFNNFIVKQKEKYSIIYIIDIHATIREIYEYCIPDLYHILGTRYLYIKERYNFIDTIKSADFAFVVSDEEIAEVNRYCPNENIQFIKIRCGCYSPMNINQYFVDRKAQRLKFGFNNDTLAFVYSGSKDRWQKFEETISLFEKIQKKYTNCKFGLYMKLNDKEKDMLEERLGADNIFVRWVSPEQMKKELTAFDCGVILRDNKWTNRVAFPNKFSDYIAGGLNIVLSSSLRDPFKLTQKYSLQLFDQDNIEKSVRQLYEIRNRNLKSHITNCVEMINRELLYSIQVRNATELVERLHHHQLSYQSGKRG